ncbi:MAG: response regulator transcription factor [Gaiellales bacterium]
MLRVLLIEDEDLMRLALASMLPDETITVVGAYADAASAVAAAQTTAFDVLVTDLDLGQGQSPNGIVVANVLRRLKPEIGVVLLTSYADPRLVGAKLDQVPARTEYVRKQSVREMDTLRTAIRRAAYAQGEALPPLPEVELTDGQIETMRLVAQGLTNAEIARQRVVAERTVEKSIQRIAQALGSTGDSTTNTRVLLVRAYFELAGGKGAHDKLPS